LYRYFQGVHVNEVVQQLNGRFSEPQVREAVEHLVNEGHLYSTIDDDHFKSTLL
jgi:replication factor A2